MTAPLPPTQQKEEWKVFCPMCNDVWVVYYPHSGAELCESCKPLDAQNTPEANK